jgi:hypothetical protein
MHITVAFFSAQLFLSSSLKIKYFISGLHLSYFLTYLPGAGLAQLV